jgi:hypothetical protein
MPTDIEKLQKKIKQLSDALCKQSRKRQELEQASIKETTKILTDISTILHGVKENPMVERLGVEFFECCGGHPFAPQTTKKQQD